MIRSILGILIECFVEISMKEQGFHSDLEGRMPLERSVYLSVDVLNAFKQKWLAYVFNNVQVHKNCSLLVLQQEHPQIY